MIRKLVFIVAGGVTAALASSGLAFACLSGCHDECYDRYGDNPTGFQYRGCIWDCNSQCDPFNEP